MPNDKPSTSRVLIRDSQQPVSNTRSQQPHTVVTNSQRPSVGGSVQPGSTNQAPPKPGRK